PVEAGGADEFLDLDEIGRGQAVGVGEGGDRPGVTALTRISVVCADRTVAMSSWNGVSKSSSHFAFGYTSARIRLIFRARRVRPSGVSCANFRALFSATVNTAHHPNPCPLFPQ